MARYYPGDNVVVLDTSNGKKLDGTVRKNMPGGSVEVWMHRFKRYFVFGKNDLTRLGRFRIVSASRFD